MALDVEQIIADLKESSILEINELVEAIEEEFDVEAAAPVAAAGAGAGAAEEEQTEFDVELTEVGSAKIQVIKAVREITGLGLKDAKGLVDEAPSVIKEAVDQDEADEIKEAIEEAGGAVELK